MMRAEHAGVKVPQTIDDVTGEWLTDALQGSYEGVTVEALSVRGQTKGTTTRLRLSVEYNSAGRQLGLPTALFLKTSAENTHHDYLRPLGIYQAEIDFYRRWAGVLPIPTARCVLAHQDPATGAFVLLLEDLVAGGAVWGSALEPFTQEQARAIVETMAA